MNEFQVLPRKATDRDILNPPATPDIKLLDVALGHVSGSVKRFSGGDFEVSSTGAFTVLYRHQTDGPLIEELIKSAGFCVSRQSWKPVKRLRRPQPSYADH